MNVCLSVRAIFVVHNEIDPYTDSFEIKKNKIEKKNTKICIEKEDCKF